MTMISTSLFAWHKMSPLPTHPKPHYEILSRPWIPVWDLAMVWEQHMLQIHPGHTCIVHPSSLRVNMLENSTSIWSKLYWIPLISFFVLQFTPRSFVNSTTAFILFFPINLFFCPGYVLCTSLQPLHSILCGTRLYLPEICSWWVNLIADFTLRQLCYFIKIKCTLLCLYHRLLVELCFSKFGW